MGSGGTAVCLVPPGSCNVTIINAGTASVYLGAGGTAAPVVLGGMPLPSGGTLAFQRYAGNGGATLWGITSAGSASVGFWVSSAHGVAQPGIF